MQAVFVLGNRYFLENQTTGTMADISSLGDYPKAAKPHGGSVPEAKERLNATEELAVRKEYENRRIRFEDLASSIHRACEAILESNDVPYHSIKSRVKSLTSTLDKLVRKHYKPSLDELEDLVGIRIICLYPLHIDPIVKLLEQEFTIHEKVDKRPAPGTTQFGYSSVHLICALTNTRRAPLPEHTGLQDMRFEIQVRTILQDAWAEIEHGLIYKSEMAAPEGIKRQIARVSAVLEMADEHFQRVYELREAYAGKLKQSDLKELRDEPLNIDSLLEVIQRKYPWAHGWQEIHGPELWADVSRLLSDMKELGITTVRQLMSVIDKWYEDEYKHSERAYLISTGKLQPDERRDWGYLVTGDEAWHDRTRQYFLPVGQLRGILMREFPRYRRHERGEE